MVRKQVIAGRINRVIGRSAWLAMVALVCMGWLSAIPAAAQDALGRGDALDANIGQGTGGRNAQRTADSFRARNLLITGNVVGGRGFRGSVGYTADQDFRGDLGANDLFEFRAGSAWSSPELARSGAISESFRLGQGFGLQEYRRSGAGATLQSVGEMQYAPGSDWWSDQLRRDRQRLDEMTAASSIGRLLERNTEPSPVGVTYSEEGDPFVISASPLRGLSVVSARERLMTSGLSSYDIARIRDDLSESRAIGRIGQPLEWRFDQLYPDPTRPGRDEARDDEISRPASGRPAGMDEEYAAILERIAERYAESNNTTLDVDRRLLNELDETYGDLRERLERMRGTSGTTGTEEWWQERRERAMESGDDPRDPASSDPSTTLPERLRPERRLPGDEDADGVRRPRTMSEVIAPDAPRVEDPLGTLEDDEEDDGPGLGLDEIAFILRHGQPVDRLSAAEESRFNELMQRAEESLRNGEYFVAERRFKRAMRFVPGHPMVSLGTAHAQLGAGLYLSASLSLQELLANHPEMIDVRVSSGLLPSRERLDAILAESAARLDEERDRAAYAFLLAYIGHQTNDRARLEQGLDVLKDVASDDPLVALLDRVWRPADDEPARESGEAPLPETSKPETTEPGK